MIVICETNDVGMVTLQRTVCEPPSDGQYFEYIEPRPCYIANGQRIVVPDAPSPAHSWNWSAKKWESTAQSICAYTEAQRADCMVAIDKAAESARLRYITGGAGQEATYIRKESQAREWQAAGFSGQAPSFIEAEAQALNVDPQSLALEVIALADFWVNTKGPQIEAARRKWKVAVAAASTVEAVQSALQSARDEFRGL